MVQRAGCSSAGIPLLFQWYLWASCKSDWLLSAHVFFDLIEPNKGLLCRKL